MNEELYDKRYESVSEVISKLEPGTWAHGYWNEVRNKITKKFLQSLEVKEFHDYLREVSARNYLKSKGWK